MSISGSSCIGQFCLASEHDAVLSCEPGFYDRMILNLNGTGAAILTVRGKSAHAGANPQDGRNALLELAYQLLQSKDLSAPDRGLKFNWTVARAGTERNVIPDLATASADVRVLKLADLNAIEQQFVAAVGKGHLIPGTEVEAHFERRRPPLEATDAARALYRKAQAILLKLVRRWIIRRLPSAGPPMVHSPGNPGRPGYSKDLVWWVLAFIHPIKNTLISAPFQKDFIS
jgi:glutamate carboxypeptidase